MTNPSQGIFYLLPSSVPEMAQIAAIVADLWPGKRIFILTADQATAKVVDDWLWRFDANRFIGHAVIGQPCVATGVHIGWGDPRAPYDVLVNLQQAAPQFAQAMQQVIDFVPMDESQKQLARKRYREYQHMGFALSTKQLASCAGISSTH